MSHEGDLAQDKAEKLKLVIQKLKPLCTKYSEHEDFRSIAVKLEDGKELVGENLESSTNFSYRVYPQNDRDLSIFVKIGFEYARWNPDKTLYDLDRITFEYEMLRKFSNLLGDEAPVAKPYVCMNIAPKMKMIVAQWAPAHEVWAHQFVRGEVDPRIMKKLSRFIAMVNAQSFETDRLNNGIKDSFRGLYPIAKGFFAQLLAANGEATDHFVEYASQLGQERFDEIIDGLATGYERCDVLLHGDAHAMNVLVEPIKDNGCFGEKGEYYMCDWEMAHVGDKGRDPGTFYAWPILCSYFLAARGEKNRSYDILVLMRVFWDEYSAALVENDSKYKSDIADIFKSCLGWCGVYTFIANYMIGVQRNYMPFDQVSEEAAELCLASVAVTGVKCLELGFLNIESKQTIDELWTWFEDLIKEHIEFVAKKCSV